MLPIEENVRTVNRSTILEPRTATSPPPARHSGTQSDGFGKSMKSDTPIRARTVLGSPGRRGPEQAKARLICSQYVTLQIKKEKLHVQEDVSCL
jgi:hypothetical protein